MQRSAPAKQDAAPTPQRQQRRRAHHAPKKNSWMGPIAGLAAGLGLAALFSHLGMGEGMANFMMIALLAMAAFMLFRWFMRRNAPAPAMQYAGMPRAMNPARLPRSTQTPAAMGSGHAVQHLPARLRRRPPSRAKPSSTSSACRPRSTPAIWTICAPSPRPKSSPRSACSSPSAGRHPNHRRDDARRRGAGSLRRRQSPCRQRALHRPGARGRRRAPVALDEVWHLTKPASGQGGWVIAGIQQQ